MVTELQWLRRHVPLANGIPVDDTIARIISALSVSGFQDCFTSGMEDVAKSSGGEIIAKVSVRKKRIRAALNDGFRGKVLMGK